MGEKGFNYQRVSRRSRSYVGFGLEFGNERKWVAENAGMDRAFRGSIAPQFAQLHIGSLGLYRG